MFRVFALLLAALPLASADLSLLQFVPADATFVGGFNVGKLKNSPIAQRMLTRAHSQGDDYRKLVEATGFDPERDLREVIFASTTLDGASGMLAATGVFDPRYLKEMRKLFAG